MAASGWYIDLCASSLCVLCSVSVIKCVLIGFQQLHALHLQCTHSPLHVSVMCASHRIQTVHSRLNVALIQIGEDVSGKPGKYIS